jgi:unspecific monooxygenase
MDTLTLSITVVVLAVTYIITRVVFPPFNFPKNIPTIPIYVSFLGTYTSMDQKQIYEKYMRGKLEKYGAVKLYFANRWNILVVKPEYLVQIFRDEETFVKSGNQKKIPNAVLSAYTGDNVISAHGDVWKLYRRVIQKPIQFPIKSHVYTNTEKFVKLIQRDSNGRDSLLVDDYLQRLALANIAQSMLGVDFGTLDSENSELHSKLKAVKAKIFQPLYMNFPVLDSLPIKSRMEARSYVNSFREFYKDKIIEAQRTGDCDTECAAYQLYTAYMNGTITEKQMTDNLVIILVAGHENPQLFFSSLLYILAKYPEVQCKLREEFKNSGMDQINELPYLASVLYETVRFLPPLGQIINRCASKDFILGGSIHVPKGAYLGYNNYATTHSSAWVDADSFKPERWGTDLPEINDSFKHAKSNSTLPSFHGGKRACLGERFALFESKLFVRQVVTNFQVLLDPNWKERLTPAGPICPMGLQVVFATL